MERVELCEGFVETDLELTVDGEGVDRVWGWYVGLIGGECYVWEIVSRMFDTMEVFVVPRRIASFIVRIGASGEGTLCEVFVVLRGRALYNLKGST